MNSIGVNQKEIDRLNLADLHSLLLEIKDFDTRALIEAAMSGNKDKRNAHLKHMEKVEAAIAITSLLQNARKQPIDYIVDVSLASPGIL
ncbi:hypothetical protein D3C87_587550 [compost metagenome]